MWTWEQRRGKLTRSGDTFYAFGYSGHGSGLNNPTAQDKPQLGPLPRGLYRASPPIHHPRLGRYAMPLVPDPNNRMFGRSAFFIHGDNRAANRSASHGCIILPFDVRQKIWTSGDHALSVIE